MAVFEQELNDAFNESEKIESTAKEVENAEKSIDAILKAKDLLRVNQEIEILTEQNLNLGASFTVLLATYIGGVGFFLGPIFGAIFFTLLQTVIGLQTDLWALYTGLVFILTVMFLPAGITGFFAMHLVPWHLGRLGILLKPYSKIFIPGLMFVIGAICLTELINQQIPLLLDQSYE